MGPVNAKRPLLRMISAAYGLFINGCSPVHQVWNERRLRPTPGKAEAGQGERRARPAPGTDPHWPAPGPDMSDSLHAGIRYGRGRY